MAEPEVIETGDAPIKAWIEGVPVEDAAPQPAAQRRGAAVHPRHVAVMPDVHFGMGATVGSVIPTKGAIIPAAVGVDIGCGMMAVRTTLTAERSAGQPAALRLAIEAAVPHGGTDERRLERRRAECGRPPRVGDRRRWPTACKRSSSKHPKHRATPQSVGRSSARSAAATTSSRSASTRRTACG